MPQDPDDQLAAHLGKLPGPLAHDCVVTGARLNSAGQIVADFDGPNGRVTFQFGVSVLREYCAEDPPTDLASDRAALEVAMLLYETYLTTRIADGQTITLDTLL
jgi:hypothetical protein